MRERLIGAIVLVCLAVIFVPMLFETPTESDDHRISATNIPEFPAAFDSKRLPLPEPPEKRKPVCSERTEYAGGSLCLEERSRSTAAGAPKPAEPALRQHAGAPAAEQPAGDAQKAAAAALSAWVIQVGSFTQEANARTLQEQLRAGKFPAFIETVKSADGTIYRVRVGPELDRGRAEKSRDRIARALGLKGILMPYPK